LIPAKLTLTIRCLGVISALILLSKCAPSVISPPRPPLSHLQTREVVASLNRQDEAAQTLFSAGSISIKGQHGALDASILIAAAKNPLRIKIEITHPWGRPLAHILVQESGIRVLSFSEKRLYSGRLGGPIFPGLLTIPVNKMLLWSIVRAYPVLPSYDRVISEPGPRLTFLKNTGKETVVLHMGPEGLRPQSVIFPPQDTRVRYADFQNDGKMVYARKTTVTDPEENQLTVELKNMVFNDPMPPEIFALKVPADFDTIPLSDQRQIP